MWKQSPSTQNLLNKHQSTFSWFLGPMPIPWFTVQGSAWPTLGVESGNWKSPRRKVQTWNKTRKCDHHFGLRGFAFKKQTTEKTMNLMFLFANKIVTANTNNGWPPPLGCPSAYASCSREQHEKCVRRASLWIIMSGQIFAYANTVQTMLELIHIAVQHSSWPKLNPQKSETHKFKTKSLESPRSTQLCVFV